MEGIITPEEIKQMEEEFLQENHVGSEEKRRRHEEFMRQALELQKHMEEQRAKEQRQMMGVEDVMEALGVSRSHSYQIIRRLNGELEKAGYITVRGRISKAYFEKRIYGIDAG